VDRRYTFNANRNRLSRDRVIESAAYEVVYDAARLPFPAWPVALLGLAVAAAGVGLGAYFRRRGIGSALARTVVSSAIIFGVSWALLVGGGLYAQHNQLRQALQEGSFVRVEGLVHDRPSGVSKDVEGPSWVVEAGRVAHWYRYDSSLLSVGYRRSGPGSGGITDGARVRIADIGGRIARLEVER
jgi:hypothetical protein